MSQKCTGHELPRIRRGEEGARDRWTRLDGATEISEEGKEKKESRERERGEMVSTVWLLPSIMAIWFANGSKRQAEPFLPTISLRFVAGEHSPSLVQSATLKCLESTFAYARAN